MTIALPPLPSLPIYGRDDQEDLCALVGAVEARERILLEHIEMQEGRECVLLDKLTEFSNRIAELEAENSQLRTDIDDDTQLIRDLQAALDAAMAKGAKP